MSYFGTDGIRGQFGQFPITPEFIMALGYVTGQVLQDAVRKKYTTKKIQVVIGKDTRLSGDLIESALQAGFNSAGVDVCLIGQIPTPAVSHLTRSYQAEAGVVISASHNPHHDNGIKIFSSEGSKISDELQDAINKKLQEYLIAQASFAHDVINHDNPKSLPGLMQSDPKLLGTNKTLSDADGRYVEYCKATFPYAYNLKGLKIVVDCANGAGFKVAPRVFKELGAEVTTIYNEPNGININVDCGSTHAESLQQAVVDNSADLGIALDGDGDRIVMVDEHGKLLDGDAILYVLAKYAKVKPQGVVGTLMTNMALELAFNDADIEFVRANVGDRYVMQELVEKNWTLGGENSGHILCLDKSRTGDAIVAGLQVLAVMVEQQSSLAELMGEFSLLPQTLVNVRLTDMKDPYDYPELVNEFDKVEKALIGRGRLLIRRSGTEPVIRVMIEAQTTDECDKFANELAEKVKAVLQ